MKLEGLKVNFLGDSITEGVGTSDISKVYWNLLKERDGVIARGYGVGGTRIAKQRIPSPDAKWDKYFFSRIDEMDDDADIVVIFGGTNDHGHGDAPIGEFSDRTDDTFYGALHHLYQELLKKYPQAHIVVCTPLHRAGEHDAINALNQRNSGCLEDYVNIIQEVAAYYALPVLDLYRTSGIQPEEDFLRERYAPDGCHPNDAGNERIYTCMKSFLQAL